jgi:GNAT superfamily N-acetyltransferase
VTPAPAPGNQVIVIATVLVAQMAKETHSFRGEVRKLLVHPAHRRGGLGRRMMQAAERLAREDMGLEVLTLDTATRTGAREFYRRQGWTEWGVCPDYARGADGRKGECSFFVKMLVKDEM